MDGSLANEITVCLASFRKPQLVVGTVIPKLSAGNMLGTHEKSEPVA